MIVISLCMGCSLNDKNSIKSIEIKNEKVKSFDNFTFNGEKRLIHITGVPKRAVICGNNAADTLLALGADDCIEMIVLTEPIHVDQFKKRFPKAKVEVRPPAKEEMLSIKPDLIVGPRRFFSDKVLGNPEFWGERKIAAYIQEGSGPIPTLANFPPCTIESEKQFIRNMGRIFDKEESAGQYIEKIDEELRDARKLHKHPKVFAVEFIGRNIECFGEKLLIGDIVKNLNGEIISFEHPFLSKESLYFIDADVVFVIYHGGKEEEELAFKNVKASPLNRLPAVREGRLYSINYADIVGPGINLLRTIKYVKSKIYPD